jgi:hypothetical protein
LAHKIYLTITFYTGSIVKYKWHRKQHEIVASCTTIFKI